MGVFRGGLFFHDGENLRKLHMQKFTACVISNTCTIVYMSCLQIMLSVIVTSNTHVVSKRTDGAFVPHEFACLNHSVLSATHNYAPPTGHTHFTLRQQPQASVQLRNDMLQKGGCGLDIIQHFNLP